ncbi:MAG: PIN domain-containing protein [Dehalococcoides mccartyi]|uniref:PIN domain-containing protein n=1 Tax=Dehalococcoides mccartyi TaxID=61435 RepID=A0AB38Z7W2_9CHLR|nr:PIN domain-containing protein [Dehalococcoides mccartyi]MDP4279310.1 PIN domain-containing protein [Dehalococcoides mccartyi]WRO06674.1 PIN domain-containing protein [Dehalococcoides mccartyi]WRO07378.1 PIN domain-containing protein [Dehalococcoides mccartyi]
MANICKKICWDTNCFLAIFNQETDRFEICNSILEMAESSKIELYTSIITPCECAKIKNEFPSEAEEQISNFFKHRFIKKVTIDDSVSRIVRRLIWDCNSLKLSDAIHLATAISIKAEEFHTCDADDLLKLNGCIKGYNLKIMKPFIEFQPTLTKNI